MDPTWQATPNFTHSKHRSRLFSLLGRALYRMLLLIVATLLVTFLVALAWLYFRQESLLFFPAPLPVNHQFDLCGVTEEKIEVEGATLSALHYRQPGSAIAKGVIFFLHGNGGNLQNWLTSTEFYQRTGYDVFMMDFRGYGKSTGKIGSEAQLHADILVAWRQIENEYAGRKNVIYGRSLGTGLATSLVAKLATDETGPGLLSNAPALMVLVSPYASLQQIGKELYPWVPDFVMRYPMRTDQWLPQVRIPTLILHGARDELIPVSHARQLKAIRPETELVILPEANHNDMHMHAEYIETLAEHLRKL